MQHPAKTLAGASTGTMIVARDLAHAKMRERLEAGKGCLEHFKNHLIYYAGTKR